MKRGFLGGLGRAISGPARGSAEHLVTWNGGGPDWSCWLNAWDLNDQVFRWDGLALVIRGYLRLAGSRDPLNRERIAEELRWRYLENGALDLTGLEGHATVVLLDAHLRQALLARPANSTQTVFYQAANAGLLLGSNLAELAALTGPRAKAEPLAIATWLDLGAFPDQLTLFPGIARLLPGECILWNEQGLERGTLPRSAVQASPSRGRLEEVMRDCAALARRPVHGLTGSLASILLQTLRNQELDIDEMLPATVSVCIDAADAWDQTDAIMEASRILGTDHYLVSAPDDLPDALRETLATMGEPSAFIGDLLVRGLASAIRSRGHAAIILDAGGDTWPAEEEACWQLFAQTAWIAGCFAEAGVETICPLLDSRLFPGCDLFAQVRNGLLSDIRAGVPRELRRPTSSAPLLGEWLRPGKPLWPLVQHLQTTNLVSGETLARAKTRPTEFLYRLICCDLWQQNFLDQTGAAERSGTSRLPATFRRARA